MSIVMSPKRVLRKSGPRAPAIPLLENGDHLTQPEFQRRYEAMPHIKKAELIDGVVYMSSPVSSDYHGEPHLDMSGEEKGRLGHRRP